MHLGAASAWGALLGVFIPSFAGVVCLVEGELVLCWGDYCYRAHEPPQGSTFPRSYCLGPAAFLLLKRHRVSFWGDKKVLELNKSDGSVIS